MIKVKNAGIASVILSKSIAFTALVIDNPTVTRTGVIAALGTIKNSGLKNNASTNINALVTAISPVRPPSKYHKHKNQQSPDYYNQHFLTYPHKQDHIFP